MLKKKEVYKVYRTSYLLPLEQQHLTNPVLKTNKSTILEVAAGESKAILGLL